MFKKAFFLILTLLTLALLILAIYVHTSPAFSGGVHSSGTMTTPGGVAFNGLNWGSFADTGPYTLAPGLTNYVVQNVDGNTPSISDLNSLWYHHHTRVAVASGGRVWVAYSGNLTAESQSGMITEVNSSADNWHTSTGPVIVIQPPSQFLAKVVASQRISYPRAFVTYQGQLYLVAAIDKQADGCCSQETGLALVATAMNRDGTIGKPFLINPPSYPYTPLSGYPNYTYNAAIAPYLYQQANNFGVWGGSAPGYPASPWTGYTTSGISNRGTFVEPSTIAINNNGSTLLRLWRCVSGGCNSARFYSSRSLDYGKTWSVLTQTNVPNQPSASGMTVLSDGRIALVGNAQNDSSGVPRDPLFLALFNGQTGMIESVYAVRQGLAGRPQYPTGQSGGAQYPGITEYNGKLWISYSIAKQVIGITSIPVAGL